jgi:hypothetical protein
MRTFKFNLKLLNRKIYNISASWDKIPNFCAFLTIVIGLPDKCEAECRKNKTNSVKLKRLIYLFAFFLFSQAEICFMGINKIALKVKVQPAKIKHLLYDCVITTICAARGRPENPANP